MVSAAGSPSALKKRISRNLIQSNAPFLSNPTSTKLSSKIKQSTKHFQNIQKTFSISPQPCGRVWINKREASNTDSSPADLIFIFIFSENQFLRPPMNGEAFALSTSLFIFLMNGRRELQEGTFFSLFFGDFSFEDVCADCPSLSLSFSSKILSQPEVTKYEAWDHFTIFCVFYFQMFLFFEQENAILSPSHRQPRLGAYEGVFVVLFFFLSFCLLFFRHRFMECITS